jgi:putative heme-binding domain-containing protein
MKRNRRLLRFPFCLVGVAICAVAQAPITHTYDGPAGVETGAALFQLHCAYCHGARGEGGRGADLTSGIYRRGGSDANLYATIRNGIGSEMPAVRATDEEVWNMVGFVKRLGSAGLREKATGDPGIGKIVYQGKGRCMVCHSIGLDGGTLGPELTDVGRRRSLARLQQALLDPEADVSPRYRGIQVVTKTRQTVAGLKLNEDDVSIQIRDSQDNLRSFLKENLRELRRDQPSLMPAYGKLLTNKEIADVIAYLSSLRGEQ